MAVATTAMPGTTIQVKHVPATKEPTDNEETIKNIDSFWMSSARIGARLSRLLRTRKKFRRQPKINEILLLLSDFYSLFYLEIGIMEHKIVYRNIIILQGIGHKMKCPLIF